MNASDAFLLSLLLQAFIFPSFAQFIAFAEEQILSVTTFSRIVTTERSNPLFPLPVSQLVLFKKYLDIGKFRVLAAMSLPSQLYY